MVILCSPGSKFTTDDVVRDVRNSGTCAYRDELVEAAAGAVPASAKRWGPSQEGSAPTVGGLVSELSACWVGGSREPPSASAGQDRWDSLIQIPQPERPTSGHVSIFYRHPVQHFGGSAGTAVTRVKRVRKSLVIFFG